MEKNFMKSIEDELTSLTDEAQGVAKTVSDKLNTLAGSIPKDKNGFMDIIDDVVDDVIDSIINGMSTSFFNSSAGENATSVTPYDDLTDLFLDSASGYTFPSVSNLGLKPPRTRISRGKLPQNSVGAPGQNKVDYNLFQHRPNGDSDITGQYAEKGIGAAFVPNILDNYDTITYHWKLFIVSPESTANGAILDAKNQTIIAESGVTDLTIDKVEIGGVVTPSAEGGTGTSTSVKFEIIEPSGAAMLDKLFYEAISLGVGNWAVMPLYLQLEFRARDVESSTTLTTELKDEITSLKWVWPLKLTDTRAHVTHVGTRYEFSAIPYSELAQSNVNFILQHNVKLEDLVTFSDAIRELENKINIDQIFKLTNNYSIPDLYQFHIDPELFSHKISTGNNQDSTRANNMDNLTLKDATFNTGTSIDKIIDNLLAHTEYYQKEFLGARAPGAEGSPATEIPAMKKFWRVVTDARPLRYDPRRQDDAKVFTIYIIRYDMGTADSNVFQQTNSKNYQEVERKRLMTYINNKILKKKYNYIFTGLNDQVINLDLKLTNAYAIAMHRMSGVYTNLAMSDKGLVTHENAEKELEITSKIASYVALKNSSKFANSDKTEQALESARRAIADSTLDPEQLERMKAILEQYKSGSRLEVHENIVANQGIGNGSTSSRAFVPKSLAAAVADTDYRFVSDVDLMDPATTERFKDFLESTKGKLRPIARIETTQDRQIGIGLESASNSGIQKLSTMYSTALEGFDTGFIKVQMTIKGDPFWLFPAPISGDARPIYLSLQDPQEAIDWIKQSHITRDSTVNYFSTDNFIVIRFRTPRVYSEDDYEKRGSPEAYNEVSLLSGVYRVTQVVSKFETGKFTQELTCVIDNEIDLRNFVKEIDNVMQSPDIPATVDDLLNPTSETNERYSRLNGDDNYEGVDPQVLPSATTDITRGNLNNSPGIGSLLPGSSLSGINSRRIF